MAEVKGTASTVCGRYRFNGRECVCSRWDLAVRVMGTTQLESWPRSQGHHTGCRRLLGNKVEGMTPAEAFERFGEPGGELHE